MILTIKKPSGWILSGETSYLINHATKYLASEHIAWTTVFFCFAWDYFWNTWVAKGRLGICGLQCSRYKRHFCWAGGFGSPARGGLAMGWQEGMAGHQLPMMWSMDLICMMCPAPWTPSLLCPRGEGATGRCQLSQSWAEHSSGLLSAHQVVLLYVPTSDTWWAKSYRNAEKTWAASVFQDQRQVEKYTSMPTIAVWDYIST